MVGHVFASQDDTLRALMLRERLGTRLNNHCSLQEFRLVADRLDSKAVCLRLLRS